MTVVSVGPLSNDSKRENLLTCVLFTFSGSAKVKSTRHTPPITCHKSHNAYRGGGGVNSLVEVGGSMNDRGGCGHGGDGGTVGAEGRGEAGS